MTITDSGLLTEVRSLTDQVLDAHSEDTDPTDLIRDLAEAGLLDPQLLDDDAGRDGGSMAGAGSPASAVIAALAAANAAVPVVEHLWMAVHLLDVAGLRTAADADAPLLTAALGTDLSVDRLGEDLSLDGTLDAVSGVDVVDGLVVLLGDGTVARVPRGEVQVSGTRRLGSMAWSKVEFAQVRVHADAHAPTTVNADDFRERNAAGRLLAIRAAAARATELTTDHLSSRVQFGRELRKFQAAQNRLSACIGEQILLSIGSDLALTGRKADIAAARIDARRSVTVIRDNTHQLHGAMGITADYPLSMLSTNMIAWLADTGSDRWWIDRAKTMIAEAGPWATITGEEDET